MNHRYVDQSFWKSKKVFITGHTGFKGSWLSLWLSSMGAEVTGYALAPNTNPNLFDILNINSLIFESVFADIRDLDHLQKAIKIAKPDVVIHMAAQPLVRLSYTNPVETYSTNVMGTVNLLESLRPIESVRASIVVTTDKCYENKEWMWGYRENDPMGGYDPYSSSKGCSELVTSAYRQSFYSEKPNSNQIASARAGNVIGGGDWSEDRLIPDAIRAFESGSSLRIRNPLATRPWQHVLEPLSAYLILAQALYEDGSLYATSWNFGPADEDNCSVRDVVDLVISEWNSPAKWEKEGNDQPHEAHFLKLDCSKAYNILGWRPKWSVATAVAKTVEWQKSFNEKNNIQALSLNQITQFMER
tara:strand:+ start:5510 stop:6586 length:1077 start_codon:yes stop_codon:yes gene_type:complete